MRQGVRGQSFCTVDTLFCDHHDFGDMASANTPYPQGFSGQGATEEFRQALVERLLVGRFVDAVAFVLKDQQFVGGFVHLQA